MQRFRRRGKGTTDAWTLYLRGDFSANHQAATDHVPRRNDLPEDGAAPDFRTRGNEFGNAATHACQAMRRLRFPQAGAARARGENSRAPHHDNLSA